MNATAAPIELSLTQSSAYWRLMRFFNLYRGLIACVFIGLYFFLDDALWWEKYNNVLFFQLALGYLTLSLLAAVFIWLKWPRFDYQLSMQTIADIGFIVALTYAAGGIESGFGLLLVIAVAAASLVSQGRLALFYAAIASIGLLLEQSYQMLVWDQHYNDYYHPVMLSLSCFATAWLAHSFGLRARRSEALASQRGIDLENLAQINELITQEMPDGLLVVDHDFRLRHHNLQAERLLGIEKHSWDAQTLDECAPEMATLMRSWINQGGDIGPGAVKLNMAQHELHLRFMPLGADRRQGAVIFIEDWSQMQAQAQQLKLAALGRLTANIAHEIRNPLSAISHANQLLQEQGDNDASEQRMLQIISDNVRRMDQMVKDVLELNRRDRTRQELINLRAFLFDFHEQFCEVEKVPAGAFQLELDEHNPQIMFDYRHLNQVLWNLCRNAWRHSRQLQKSVVLAIISTAGADRDLRISVSDDGPGVAAEATVHLFEPFFTTESTGTGLGLYIARELCEANGAAIQYQPMDQGSLFMIHLRK